MSQKAGQNGLLYTVRETARRQGERAIVGCQVPPSKRTRPLPFWIHTASKLRAAQGWIGSYRSSNRNNTRLEIGRGLKGLRSTVFHKSD